MRLSKTLGLVSVLALMLMGTGAVADDDHDHGRDDSRFGRDHDHDHDHDGFDRRRTATPIKHVVVIFQENISFDHYFATYPNAQNRPGETPFYGRPYTPAVNNLKTPLDVNHGFFPLKGIDLISQNPNGNPNAPAAPNNNVQNGVGASNPFRLAPGQALTADQGHNEMPEQSAYNNGQMDGFPAFVGTAGPPPAGIGT
jgi:phospholipase C